MKIKSSDILTGQTVQLTATLTTDHPASSYGQPVMVIDEWEGGCMGYDNWVIGDCVVTEFDSEAEQKIFERWVIVIHQMIYC